MMGDDGRCSGSGGSSPNSREGEVTAALEYDSPFKRATIQAIPFYTLVPIRPRSRGARRSLRTFPVVTLHPRFPFNVRLTGKTFD